MHADRKISKTVFSRSSEELGYGELVEYKGEPYFVIGTTCYPLLDNLVLARLIPFDDVLSEGIEKYSTKRQDRSYPAMPFIYARLPDLRKL